MTQPPDLSKLSHAEKDALILALFARLNAAHERIAIQDTRIAALEARQRTDPAAEDARQVLEAAVAGTEAGPASPRYGSPAAMIRAGSECALSRLSELLFVEVVRDYLAQLQLDSAGWLGGLRDPLIGRALAALHDRPAHPWTLDELATISGVGEAKLAKYGQPVLDTLAESAS